MERGVHEGSCHGTAPSALLRILSRLGLCEIVIRRHGGHWQRGARLPGGVAQEDLWQVDGNKKINGKRHAQDAVQRPDPRHGGGGGPRLRLVRVFHALGGSLPGIAASECSGCRLRSACAATRRCPAAARPASAGTAAATAPPRSMLYFLEEEPDYNLPHRMTTDVKNELARHRGVFEVRPAVSCRPAHIRRRRWELLRHKPQLQFTCMARKYIPGEP